MAKLSSVIVMYTVSVLFYILHTAIQSLHVMYKKRTIR